MNIGVDIRHLVRGVHSGVGVYTYQLLKHLFAIDKENRYYLFYNSYRDVKATMPVFDFPNVHLIDFHYPNKLLNASLSFFNYPKIDSLVSDTIHTRLVNHETFFAPKYEIDVFFTPNWLFSSMSHRVKHVLTVHDVSIWRTPEFFSWKQRVWHRFVKIKELARSADAIICVSRNTYEDVKELFHIDDERLVIIYEGPGRGFKKITDTQKLSTVRAKYKLPEKFIFTIGNIEPRKNIDGIIAGFESFKNKNGDKQTHLVIIGDPFWNKHYTKQVNSRIAASKANEYIHMLGYVPTEDEEMILSQARAFLFPSFYEGFGLSILEAFACWVPVIASFSSSLPEVARNAAVLVDPYNIEDISGAIAAIMSDQKLAHTLRERGGQALTNFSWTKAAQETLKVFLEC